MGRIREGRNQPLTDLVNCIESVQPPKKAGRPVVLQLLPNFDYLSQMRNLQIHFLDHGGMSTLSTRAETWILTDFPQIAYPSVNFWQTTQNNYHSMILFFYMNSEREYCMFSHTLEILSARVFDSTQDVLESGNSRSAGMLQGRILSEVIFRYFFFLVLHWT